MSQKGSNSFSKVTRLRTKKQSEADPFGRFFNEGIMKKINAIILTVLLLTACAGTAFKWSDARKITPGMTTQEVAQLIGQPTSVTSRDGVLIYVWVWVNTFSGTRSLRVDFKDNKAITAPPIPDSFQD